MPPPNPKRAVKPLVLHAHTIHSAPAEQFPDPREGGNVSWKTLISAPVTLTDTLTAGIATCPVGSSVACPAREENENESSGHLKLHRHTQAELYHVISGTGVVSIEGVEYEVGKGSVVFIPGDAEHGIRNVGDEELTWLYVFAADGFGEVVYRFSGDGAAKAKL